LFGVEGIFDNLRDGIVLARLPEANIELWNLASKAIFGYSENEALALPLERLFRGSDVVDRARESGAWAMGAWPGHGQAIFPAVGVRKDGREIPVEVTFCRVANTGAGGPLVLLVVRPALRHEEGASHAAREREARRVDEAAFRERLGEAAQEAANWRAGIGDAALDLTGPLMTMRVQLELLKFTLTLTPQQQEAFGVVEQNLRRLMAEVQDLFESSRIESGRLLLAPEVIDIAEVVHEAVRAHANRARRYGVSLVAAPAKPLAIEADHIRTRHALDNLIGNALKFTPNGGSVSVRVGRQGDRAVVEVEDTGPGIPAEQLPKLFRPFHRAARPDHASQTGTGLGLFVAKGIIEKHGGRIGCRSDGDGRGATFWFELPLQTPLQHSREAAEARSEEDVSAS
jgi:signal transduction histidine kinase